ncbi:MAG: HD-like signal output (HDOD) protein [Sulfurimonas sp.]|jgi:HD-like signal output (HDOD) protein|uniref:HDOD domain-containing protein n=1 Tax=Sulfurimonas sp. TaxID=2022749 RepID=UPI0039E4E0DA
MDYKSLVDTIESLPPLSDSAILIKKLYDEGAENVDIIKLVRIIESDALLTANVLKMINAPFYGFSRKIASVSQAVSLFGTHIMYGLVINFAMTQKIKAKTQAYNLSPTEFNEMCHIQSHLMMQWYSKVDLRHAQFLAPLALIMESGKLVLAQEIANSAYTVEFKQGLKECEEIEKYEYELVGTTSYHLSGLLFDHWNLEPLYVKMLKNLDIEDEEITGKMEYYIDTLDVIRTAVNVKEFLTDESIAKASIIVRNLDLDHVHFEHVARRIKNAYNKKKR